MIDDLKGVLAALKPGLDAVDARSSFYAPLNVIPRLETGKWELKTLAGVTAFVSDADARLIPPPDKADYFRAIIEWAMKFRVLFVPAYMVDALRQRGFKVTKIQTEYVMDLDRLRMLPGGDLRNMRYDVSRARRVTDAMIVDPTDHKTALLDLTRRWYAEAKDRLWRPSEKALIDWLIGNWSYVRDLEPTAACAVVHDRATKELISFELGSALTASYAVSFTQRSDRAKTHGVFAGANLLCSITLADHMGLPVNDGPADHKELAARKLKLAAHLSEFYAVQRR